MTDTTETQDRDDVVNVEYTNWRGETKIRRLILGDVCFGTTDWHPYETYLITAFDLDHPAQIWKEYDLKRMNFAKASAPEAEALRAEVARLRNVMRGVEAWWLEDRMHKETGAPHCIFALRAALAPEAPQ